MLVIKDIQDNMKTYRVENYQKQKPFSGFLPGISGVLGIPMWVFYVNRGQGVATFGVRDKNGSLMEFYPANLSYTYTAINGFRTFIKVNGIVKELFLEEDGHQTLEVDAHQFKISQFVEAFNLDVVITYATLPNSSIAGLIRKVAFVNRDSKPKQIEVIDGLMQLLPSGVDHGASKSISNLLQSWMQVDEYPSFIFLKLRASTADSSEVNVSEDGHFYHYTAKTKVHYIYDYKVVFKQDTSFKTPYGFIEQSVDSLSKNIQTAVNQVPSGMMATSFQLVKSEAIYGLFGYGKKPSDIKNFLHDVQGQYFDTKLQENKTTIDDITKVVKTKTSEPMFDAYLEQCQLDNVLRGGFPKIWQTKQGPVAYHLFSRKHGDLERDYNFFSLEPAYLSQGNGAFRDVLQNRRSDLFIEPLVGDVTIRQFLSFVQADGYNPLSIEGIKFTYHGVATSLDKLLQAVVSKPFTPGEIAMAAERANLNPLQTVETILKDSTYEFVATFGEGYWQDHFTYLMDLLDSYQSIFPDKIESLLFNTQLPYFISPVFVKPRSEKFILKNQAVRQYHAIHHDHHLPVRGWLQGKNGTIQSTIFAKLLTLSVNKFSQLDPEALGLMYEAEKPGWNDAMNGISGLFGSGVSELFELQRLIKFLSTFVPKKPVSVLAPLLTLIHTLISVDHRGEFKDWDARVTALESYRESLKTNLELGDLDGSTIQTLITKMTKVLDASVGRIEKLSQIPPTYLTYEAVEFQRISKDGASVSSQGYPFVHVTKFKRIALPQFLEAPARYLSNVSTTSEKRKALYSAVHSSELFDTKLKLYKTSIPLDSQSMEIGRIRAFTPGWLERESDFLHMSYKFLLGLFKAELYDTFFDEIRHGFTCFMDPIRYGRSPLENSSFIATSNNPDATKHGQGFFARLSGSTAEVISVWRLMFFGQSLFSYVNNALSFEIQPKIPANFFKDGVVETTLFSDIHVIIHYQGKKPTYDKSVYVEAYELKNQLDAIRLPGASIQGRFAHEIREKKFSEIHVYLKGGT
jgi:hypothetical protein